MKKKVLIIDNDLKVCKEIKYALQNETTDAYYALTVQEGLEYFLKYQYCLVIMDVFLAETDGLLLLKQMQQLKTVPILVLSSTADECDRVSALTAGAHGYIQKPYKLEECLAQAESLMRLYLSLNKAERRCYTLAFGMDLIIDPTRRQVTLKGQTLGLTRREFDLLFCLTSHAGQVLSREQLYNYVWSDENEVNVDDIIKNHIKKLRQKLTPSGKELIKNRWGVGYYFTDEEQ